MSRCQRYDFKRISQEGIIGRLEKICNEQGLSYELPALAFLAQKSDGAMRDAISLLDQTLASCGDKLTLAASRAATGSIDKEFIETFAQNIIQVNGAEILRQVSVLFSEGRDPSDFIAELMQIFRNVLVLLTIKNPEGLIYETAKSLEYLKEIASNTNKEELTLMIKELSKLDSSLKWALQRKILFEAGMLALCDRKWDSDESQLTERIAVLEQRISDLVRNGVRVQSKLLPQQTEMPPAPLEPPVPQEPPVPPIPEMPLISSVPAETNFVPEPQPVERKPEEVKPAVATPIKSVKSVPAGVIIESDELDWKDFLSNVSSKGQASLSALIKINSRGVLDGKGNLILVFANAIVKDMIVKKDATEILSESASSAYGMPLRVIYATKNDDLDSFAPAEKAKQPSPAAVSQPVAEDSFCATVDLLKELSEQEGFKVELV